jgi:energy-coupling factor transporter ATP-binding protein EcfA2
MDQNINFEQALDGWLLQIQQEVPQFVLDASNKALAASLLAYFAGSRAKCHELGIKPQKGLFLLGPVGCGKSTLMRWFAHHATDQKYSVLSCWQVVRKYEQEGPNVLQSYGWQSFRKKPSGYGMALQYDQPITYCFDDLGAEPSYLRYGQPIQVMEEILLDRYEHFVRYGMKTHLTTNLNAQELEQRYGERLRSRLREMCNLISFSTDAPDRRK